jgi:hypothetical protein
MSGANSNPDLLKALGGKSGIIEAGLPTLVFMSALTVTERNLRLSLIAALISAGTLVIVRLARGGTLQNAISGALGVVFAAWLASRSGKAEDFFLPGILWNIGYATAILFSLAIRRPLIGFVLGGLTGDAVAWTKNSKLKQRYTAITWIWFGVFTTRVVIMLPLYIANQVELLGVFKLVLGWPLFALGLWLTYRLNNQISHPNEVID